MIILIKAIFFDLDGTLLNSNHRISETDTNALKKCSEKGIKLFLSTARPISLVKSLEWSDDEKNLFDGGIYCNGAVVNYKNTTECLYIPTSVTQRAVEIMKSYTDIRLTLQMPDNSVAFNIYLPESDYKNWGLDKKPVYDIENFNTEKIVKILISDGDFINYLNPLPQKLISDINEKCSDLSNVYVTDNGCIIQICNKRASKFFGVESIRKKLNIKKDEIAVFGDDKNDIEMICSYKNSIAMGNSTDEIKHYAGFITKSNDENGVSYALIHLLNLI